MLRLITMNKIKTSKKLKIFFIFVFIFLDLACTSIEVNPPLPIVVSPRLGVPGKFLLRGNVEPALRVEVDGMYSRPPVFTRRTTGLVANQTPEAGFAKSFWEATGAVFLGSYRPGMWGQAKLQLLGPQGVITNTNTFITIFARYGSQTGTASGDQKVIFGGGGYPWSGEVKVDFATAGLSLGQTFDKWLIYIGGAYMDFPMYAKSTQERADDNSDPGGQYTRTYHGISSSAGLGFEYLFGERRSLGFNVHYNSYDFDGLSDATVPVSIYIKIL